ncbi:MAG: hypothetical protein KGK01_02180 [Bradyrhizobium sp.]|uniref:hypothetical protein n=1 Tax=Bradyrhizobium sp. TaxID=376 RepID=UPI001C2A000B|nr:hypothetical protein [Bradyrhizobium sp.]MBU6461926.1 hypothetical protein [Pseudomonadota bacterium]MDE2066903.1 hypothetical protein [Bradyrhizobium sp.]MDE2241272.1 hypothetical protein [Bradyrhizobium sp.]MDE2470106.1 hypothetical protein [Bradyrhizobium sp.]
MSRRFAGVFFGKDCVPNCNDQPIVRFLRSTLDRGAQASSLLVKPLQRGVHALFSAIDLDACLLTGHAR